MFSVEGKILKEKKKKRINKSNSKVGVTVVVVDANNK